MHAPPRMCAAVVGVPRSDSGSRLLTHAAHLLGEALGERGRFGQVGTRRRLEVVDLGVEPPSAQERPLEREREALVEGAHVKQNGRLAILAHDEGARPFERVVGVRTRHGTQATRGRRLRRVREDELAVEVGPVDIADRLEVAVVVRMQNGQPIATPREKSWGVC